MHNGVVMRHLLTYVAALAACSRLGPNDFISNSPSLPNVADASVAAQDAGAGAILDAASAELKGLFGALPTVYESTTNPITEPKVTLGRMLYFEARLSKTQEISCNSCHDLGHFGVEAQDHPALLTKNERRNTPTVLNAAGQSSLCWDGRAPDVEAVAKFHLLNPTEMAMDEKRVVETLSSMPEYVRAFAAAFPTEPSAISVDNVARAIGAFERKLVTPSRWDKYLAGDANALTADEKVGFGVFVQTGCGTCHMGPLIGGSLIQKLGLMSPWPYVNRDQGRYDLSRQEAERMMFKVPTLRNVEKTAPYLNDGSVASLEEMVRLMGKHQLGKQLGEPEIRSIVRWLRALTGEIPQALAVRPTLPASTPKTPKPEGR
jgi:cytochrome c peroxidase